MRVLLVEDDDHIAGPLIEGLRRFGHEVRHVEHGVDAVSRAADTDCVLLDLGLPDLDGHEVCRRVRRDSWVPLIAVTARADEIERVLLLQAGADDYVTKPFSLRELMARMEAVSRRHTLGSHRPAATPDQGTAPEGASYGPLTVDPRTRRSRVGDRSLELTRREFDLLAALFSDPGAVRSREDLIDEVWDTNWHGSTRTLDVHIGQLRTKLGHREWIQSVRGVGFRLNIPPATP